MVSSINLPLYRESETAWGGWDELRRTLNALGVDGVEGIWSGVDIPADFPPDLLTGYHLTFFPDWLDFYRGDERALGEKFGSVEEARRFYGGADGESLLALYREDLARAVALGAGYVVFHVSDVSIEEGYTYQWLHRDEEVIDASVEIVNRLLDGVAPTFDFLVENQWWPGFTFTDPAKTGRLLEGIRYERKGILLDTGHLMNTHTGIAGQREGIAYIRRRLAEHGDLSRLIRGVHLHQSVSGAYVRAHTGRLPEGLPRDNVQRFAQSYGHIQRIDRHQPWSEPLVAQLVEDIAPRYLTHELAAPDPRSYLRALRQQLGALNRLPK